MTAPISSSFRIELAPPLPSWCSASRPAYRSARAASRHSGIPDRRLLNARRPHSILIGCTVPDQSPSRYGTTCCHRTAWKARQRSSRNPRLVFGARKPQGRKTNHLTALQEQVSCRMCRLATGCLPTSALHEKVENMAQGTVKWFNSDKGFGFIAPDSGAEDLFVHHSEIRGSSSLEDNQRVQFEVGQGPKGPRAVAVTAI